MAIARILRERTIGETRWLALDPGGQPAALYLERPSNPAVLGARLAARIGRTEPGAGGTFIDIPGTKGAFLRSKRGQSGTNQDNLSPSEGAAVTAEIVSEARAEKLPRVKLISSDSPPPPTGADAWRAALVGGATAPLEDVPAGDAVITAAFDDALIPDVTLPGGGRLRIERTRALTAADIDSAGRAMRGSAGARALSLNREAASELARQILLRGLGGLFVLDCVSPLAGDGGSKIRAAFLSTWDNLIARPAKALAPSSLGLMEISAGWWITPVAERMLDDAGAPTPETTALEGLRQLEKAARQDRMARLSLALPEPAWDWLVASPLDAQAKLDATYGARLKIRVHPGGRIAVSPEA